MDEKDKELPLHLRIKAASAERSVLYEECKMELQHCLPEYRAQDVEDALLMTCVDIEQSPLQVILITTTFLQNLHEIRKKEV